MPSNTHNHHARPKPHPLNTKFDIAELMEILTAMNTSRNAGPHRPSSRPLRGHKGKQVQPAATECNTKLGQDNIVDLMGALNIKHNPGHSARPLARPKAIAKIKARSFRRLLRGLSISPKSTAAKLLLIQLKSQPSSHPSRK
ncbi:hypothetical protein PRZ48_010746 [Zasmidium cellare]|uniref:Uncharacterized protein n=1 Tax=Zasmidium cellare TaxID=395010 RepID=A0ABR0E9P0_ZASCE|nr:hypothetical protein PRZ48_010746 [Zasmidium cellare]